MNRLHALHARLTGFRTYLLALILALPDILDAVAGVDISVLLPEGYGAKLAAWLAIGRIVVSIYVRRLDNQRPVA